MPRRTNLLLEVRHLAEDRKGETVIEKPKRKEWKMDMVAEPVVPSWSVASNVGTNGSELQRAIIKGFANEVGDPVWSEPHKAFLFEKEFDFKEHGEFFRGALTMASLRYAGDFYDLLRRYGKIKVTITKYEKEE